MLQRGAEAVYYQDWEDHEESVFTEDFTPAQLNNPAQTES